MVWLNELKHYRTIAWRQILAYSVGFGLTAAVWSWFFFRPNLGYMRSISTSWFHLAMPKNLGSVWQGIKHPFFFWYFNHSPFILFLSLMGIPYLLLELGRSFGRRLWTLKDKITLLMLAWFCGDWFFLSVLNYHPLCYFIPIMPPLFALAALVMEKIYRGKIKINWGIGLFYFGWSGLIFWLVGFRKHIAY